MESSNDLWPWLVATLLFLVLLGGGRTIRGRWLGRPPFGAGLALSVALGVMLYSLDFALLGHFGAIHSPWPQLLLGLGVLIALPGLLWTWQDFRTPAPGLERGFGLGWFTGPAWLLIIAALAISMFWITGAFDWEARGFLFERVGVDYEIGRVGFDPDLPRDPFLGSEPLDLWLYALGSAEASLALTWWLGVALLFGVCGIGWRLHSHGAGLLAAMLFAIVLFATDRPLFVAPAFPATLALIAVIILAIESRGRPNVGHSLVAGALGGFALISDLGAVALLVPLLFFGPSWCKKASRLDLGLDPVVREPEPEPEPDIGISDEDYIKFGAEEKFAGDGQKWLPPLRHTAIGVVGLSLPLAPWLLRNDAWADDPFYGVRDDFRSELALRYEAPQRFGLQVDYHFVDRLPDPEEQDDSWLEVLSEPYLEANEWGLGLGIVTAFGFGIGSNRRRRQRILYAAPAVVGYGIGATLGDFELTHPSTLGLLSVTAGSSLHTMRNCTPPWPRIAYGGTLATGGLALALSGEEDCGYWDEKPTLDWRPAISAQYDYSHQWKLRAEYRFDVGEDPLGVELHEATPKLDYGPRVPQTDPDDTPSLEYDLRRPRLPSYKPNINRN